MYWDVTEWREDGTLRLAGEHANTTAFVQDASDYRATLYTMGEHGCTMHEATP